jgi:hypothetical protein
VTVLAAGAMAQQMDVLDALAKWASAKLIHYRVVDECRGTAQIGEGRYYGVTDVVDRVVIEFDWTRGTPGLMSTDTLPLAAIAP